MSRIKIVALGLSMSLAGWVILNPAQAEEKSSAPQPARVDFNRDIHPILSNHCYACHGPDSNKRKAGMRLDRKEEAFRKQDSGDFAIVPGDLDRSELYGRISSTDAAVRMPPPKGEKPLSKNQIELLRRWIEQGAEWKDHWAYIPPQRPELPAVKNAAWPRNGLDYFILARLEKESLTPSPEADRSTLVRRVTFDLTGLPPTPAEVDAFLADACPNAYEKVVDRLLASPHYGERMAQPWLDLARYADTNGYHIDNHRDMWKWREWVINAFNKNMPFDQFTIEQLAGDMLPNATMEQRIASGFNRNTMVNFEGGADPNEYLTKYVIDRVTTTATVWLGTTMACAECHDHKFDPFTQREFYQFYAFFNTIPELGLDGKKENPAPSIRVPTPEQTRKLETNRRQLTEIEARIAAELSRIQLDEPAPTGPGPVQQLAEYVWVDDGLPPGAQPQGNEGAASWRWEASPLHPAFSGRQASVRTAQGLSQHFFTGASQPLRIGAGDKLFAHVFLDPRNPPRTVMLQFNDGTWEHRVYWGDNQIGWGADGTTSRMSLGPLPPLGQWVRLEVSAQAVGLASGSLVNGLAFTQVDGTVYWDKAGIVTRTPQGAVPSNSLAAWEQWEKAIKPSKLPKPVQDALKIDPRKRTEKQKAQLKNHFVQYVYTKTREIFDPLNKELDHLKKIEAGINAAVPATMVMQEMVKPRDTFILIRGDFQKQGDKVTANVPRSLPALPEGVKPDRLVLAKWLVAPTHPLTSRVTVNRFWEQFFGMGLVKTSEDFGSQGEWPSHPELLDWLALEFIEGKWDIKAFQKMLVMSATYRQSAQVTRALVRRDPDNRLHARGPRFRLSAEMIRDNALAVAGLLDTHIGGPSVRPYQPAGLWQAISFGKEFSAQTYEPSKGKDLYRRGIYTYWKRALPHPSMINFDAPNREVCTDRRPRTNTPLQALELLNDPIYVECARVLGQRVLKEGGADTAARMAFAFKLCTARTPRPEELKILLGIYDQQLARFQKDPQVAQKLINIGESPRPTGMDASELAAWMAIGNVLLNLDETITKG